MFSRSEIRSARRCRGPCEGTDLPFRYLGADPHAGPNYTGRPAVAAYYRRLR